MKTKLFFKLITATALSAFIAACGGNGEHMPVAAGGATQAGGGTGSGGNKPAGISFKDVKPIFSKNCSTCHAPGGALADWTDYATAYAKRDRLYNRVIEKKDMPLGAKLADEDIKLISDWLQAGAPGDSEVAPSPIAAPPVAENPTPAPVPPSAPQPAPVAPPEAAPAPQPLPEQPVAVTFKDVKPIFENNCTMCHAPGGALPNWLDYQTSFEKRERLYDRVIVKKDMPLGLPLSEADFNTIKVWLEAQAPNDPPANPAGIVVPATVIFKIDEVKESDPIVTFKDVKPVLEKRCVGCHLGLDMGHGSQDWGVYSLAYEQRNQIYERVVVLKNMPLYSSMPKQERELIRLWVEQGAQE